MPIDSGNLALKGLDDLFSTEENRQEEQQEQVRQIPIDDLHPFTNHPFKVLDDEAMTRTVESIAQYGVLAPLIARPRPEGGYEIISGHRRQHAAELAGLLTKKRDDICLLGLLDTLEYLKRGGRISKTVAFAGGLLSIKPVVTIQDGEIALIGKARGSRQGNNLLVEKIHACGGIDFQLPILLGYTGLSDAFLRKYVDDSRALWEHGTDSLDEALISGVIGTHTGPGAVAVAFFRKV